MLVMTEARRGMARQGQAGRGMAILKMKGGENINYSINNF